MTWTLLGIQCYKRLRFQDPEPLHCFVKPRWCLGRHIFITVVTITRLFAQTSDNLKPISLEIPISIILLGKCDLCLSCDVNFTPVHFPFVSYQHDWHILRPVWVPGFPEVPAWLRHEQQISGELIYHGMWLSWKLMVDACDHRNRIKTLEGFWPSRDGNHLVSNMCVNPLCRIVFWLYFGGQVYDWKNHRCKALTVGVSRHRKLHD